MNSFRSWRLSRTHGIWLHIGYSFGRMCIGPYLLTDDDGYAYVGCGLGPLFAEICCYIGGEGRLAMLLWGD